MNEETFDSLTSYCRENDRVCPLPPLWNDLWKLLPERRQTGASWEPSLPLTLGAWHYASNLEKMARLTCHIQWAEKHGALNEIAVFLRGLTEEQWHHLGD